MGNGEGSAKYLAETFTQSGYKPTDFRVYAGCGVEFFPLPNRDRLRLHAVYFKSSSIGVDNFDIGITWRLDVIKR